MTESTGFPAEQQPAPATRDQALQDARAQLQQTAADIRGESSGGPVQEGAVDAKVREQVTREVLLPMEQKMDDLIAQFRKTSSGQDAQIRALQAQLAGAQQAAGAPEIVKYADAVRDRLTNAAELSGMPKEHWAPVLEKAGQLSADARTAVQAQDATPLEKGIAWIERFVTRGHPALSNQRIEHFPAVLADLEALVQAAERVAPAIAAAL